MIAVSLSTLIAFITGFIALVTYVGAVQYRLGRVETKVENNEKVISMLQVTGATKADVTGIKDQLSEIKSSIDKLFDMDRERQNERRN